MHVTNQQAVFPTNQVRLLDAVSHRLLQYVLAERYAGARCLPAPFKPLRANAMLDGLVDLLRKISQRVHDRLPYGGAHDRIQRVAIGLGVVSKSTLQTLANRLRQRFNELAVLTVAAVNRFRKHFCDVGGSNLPALYPIRNLIKGLFFGAEQQLL